MVIVAAVAFVVLAVVALCYAHYVRGFIAGSIEMLQIVADASRRPRP